MKALDALKALRKSLGLPPRTLSNSATQVASETGKDTGTLTRQAARPAVVFGNSRSAGNVTKPGLGSKG
jgi:hypothetical protein